MKVEDMVTMKEAIIQKFGEYKTRHRPEQNATVAAGWAKTVSTFQELQPMYGYCPDRGMRGIKLWAQRDISQWLKVERREDLPKYLHSLLHSKRPGLSEAILAHVKALIETRDLTSNHIPRRIKEVVEKFEASRA